MIVALQPQMMERTVFEAVRRDSSIETHYQRGFAKCYDEREPDRRERAFQELHDTWFCELGLRERILRVAREYEHFIAQVNRLAVTHASGPKAHAVELFGAPGRYTVAMAVTPALLLDCDTFTYWARHEFMHVDDILDPHFGHVKDGLMTGSNIAAKNLFQDRYAVLWAMSIDSRLARRGRLSDSVRERRRSEFVRAFALQIAENRDALFDSTWDGWPGASVTHLMLMDWARQGPPSVRDEGRGCDSGTAGMTVGGTCSLCGFSTFAWGTPLDASEVAEVVASDFPRWTPSLGLCARCVEVYRGVAGPRPGARTKLETTDSARPS